jgi:hypothetical protein
VSEPVRERMDNPLETFRAELRAFHLSCGKPPYSRLEHISMRLHELYPPDESGHRRLPYLAKSTVSDVLAGRRKGLPKADWLSAFVLSCQRSGWEAGLSADDVGVSSLQEWQEKLSAARLKLNAAQAAEGIPPSTDKATAQSGTDKATDQANRRRVRPPLGRLTIRLVGLAVVVLPADHRSRYAEEWRSLLYELGTRRTRARQVVSIAVKAPHQRWVLRRPLKGTPPA